MYKPLADEIRPHSLDDVVGQKHILGERGLLRRIVESGSIPNMIFYGPSGTGKTTVARIIAEKTNRTLRKLNATTAGLADIKEIIAELDTLLTPGGVLLYLDEIQYFNKKQQQSLLEFIEDGRITLIASTTENPYFCVFGAILSRSTVFEFKPVTPKEAEPPTGTDTPAIDEAIPEDFTLPITKEGQSEIITTLKVSEIHPFEGHPFNVKDDKDMWDLVDSVKKFGVLEPVVVIPRTAGGYEMISGHRRRRACELAGIATMPVIVRQLDRDEAVISMVDANLKRENISPMEKARAYAMKLEAMRRKAGRRTKEEIAALEASGEKPMRADEELAQQTGESRSNIQKLVRLTNLTPELQQMVEEKKLPIQAASDLSYLKKEEQEAVADAINKEDKVPSSAQAKELKQASQDNTLTTEKIEKAVAPTKREETPPLKVTLGEEDLRPYFPDKRTTVPDAKKVIFEALALRKIAMERQQNKTQAEKGAAKKKPPAPVR